MQGRDGRTARPNQRTGPDNQSLATRALSPTSAAAAALCGIIERGHDLAKIAVGNEPDVSGGLGSQVNNAQ